MLSGSSFDGYSIGSPVECPQLENALGVALGPSGPIAPRSPWLNAWYDCDIVLLPAERADANTASDPKGNPPLGITGNDGNESVPYRVLIPCACTREEISQDVGALLCRFELFFFRFGALDFPFAFQGCLRCNRFSQFA